MGTMFRRLERYCNNVHKQELNDIPIKDNYVEISQEEIKDAYLKYGQMKEVTQEEVGEMIAYIKFTL